MENIKDYIDSGILETLVLGQASPAEVSELVMLKKLYPEVEFALHALEVDLENIASQMAITPPPAVWHKIDAELKGLTVINKEPVKFKEYKKETRNTGHNSNQYIEVEALSDQMKINKAWKWVFAAVFVLGKIFLGCAIYFYLENRQAQQQVLELKSEVQQLRLGR